MLETFKVNEYQTLENVHRKEDCKPPCVIHYPTDHHMRDWPLHWREDRRIFERMCRCGVGHPDPDQHRTPQNGLPTHGCCGCCREPKDG